MERGKVIVANDNKTTRDRLLGIVSRLLSKQEIGVDGAIDGQSAMDFFDQHPDILAALIDYEMPYANGPEVIRYFRTVEEVQRRDRSRIALVTASEGTQFDERRESAEEAGADCAISLHFSNRQYREQIEAFFGPLFKDMS